MTFRRFWVLRSPVIQKIKTLKSATSIVERVNLSNHDTVKFVFNPPLTYTCHSSHETVYVFDACPCSFSSRNKHGMLHISSSS